MRRKDSPQAQFVYRGHGLKTLDLNSAQLKFRAPDHLRELIEQAGKRNGWGASEEIRMRLAHSFENQHQAGDDETRRLLDALNQIARNLKIAFGPWHESRFAFDTFRAAVLALVDLHRPDGKPVWPQNNHMADIYLGDDGTPETAGRMLAGLGASAVGIPVNSPRAPNKRK